ncbi:hypothetical protein SAMN05192553_104104 [Cyclobacterium xiamenense]|uniref:Uncharacterized protein n=1 Tax=Cyclobacterium xiamenense TaxID=1297121 RepID=A0A1H6Z5F6_9BACT|nr:hypothetical protein SAMN05192553_104104 [Cyclobacterium xiamenense]
MSSNIVWNHFFLPTLLGFVWPRKLRLSYNVLQTWLSSERIKDGLVGANAINLLTFAGNLGFDPAVANFNGNRQHRNLSHVCVGKTFFPLQRTIIRAVLFIF